MRIREATRALLLAAVAAAPTAASALTVSARAGVQYSRYDSFPVAGEGETMPHLDIDLALDARGVIVSRDVFDYGLRVGWGRITNETGRGATSTTDMLSYSGRASLLENYISPVGLSVFATRGETDFSTNTAADSFGRGVASSLGGTVSMKRQGLPSLTTGYTWSNTQTEIADQPLRDATQHALTSTLSFGTPAFSVNASYYGELREGSWDTDNYSLHSVTMSARSLVGTSTLSLDSSAAFTLPEELVPGTFEQRTTSFSALMNAGTEGTRRNFSYGYGHSFVESPGVPTNEVTHQGVRYEGDHFVTTSTFWTRWLLDASYAVTRCESELATCASIANPAALTEGTELRSSGETLGVSLWYRRQRPSSTLELNAGPRVSLLQGEVQEVGQATQRDESGGYGAVAGARYNRPLGLHTLQANWTANYGSDLFATAGWQFTQELGASLSGPAARARYSASLRAGSFRTHSPVTGDGAGRSLEAAGTLALPRLSADARASLSQGMLGATPRQFTSDGLLLPAPFDSTVVDVSLGASLRLFSGLSSSLRLRVARSDVPGRPVLHEAAAVGGLTYRYGELGMTVEDRVTGAETVGGWDASNLVMVTVFRSLTW